MGSRPLAPARTRSAWCFIQRARGSSTAHARETSRRSLPPFVTRGRPVRESGSGRRCRRFARGPAAAAAVSRRRAARAVRVVRGCPTSRPCGWRPGTDLLQYAARYRSAKGLLLDAFVDGMHGGSGHSFDWSLIPARAAASRGAGRRIDRRQRGRRRSARCGPGRSTSAAAWNEKKASRTRTK